MDWRLVRCEECGQMEWWTEAELRDHGWCRSRGRECWCGDTELHPIKEGL